MTLKISGLRRINTATIFRTSSTTTQKTSQIFKTFKSREFSGQVIRNPFESPSVIINGSVKLRDPLKWAQVQMNAGIWPAKNLSPMDRLKILNNTLKELSWESLRLYPNDLLNPKVEIEKFQAAVTQAEKVLNQSDKVNESTVGDVYNRFFVLMERLIKQEDGAAQEIYNRIKMRTDNIDLLTTLTAKINNAPKGTVDWSKDEEMKKLIDAARAIGVPIPDGYKFTEEQRVVLVKSIEGKQKNMESMTQLERVDFQQRMQNSSIWHQTRSNILKYLERTASTITGNMRPH